MDHNQLKIIMVEDDFDLCQGWSEVFALMGQEVKCFQKSLLVLADPQTVRQSNLLITDYYLPDLNGVELIKRVRELNPGIRAILLTGSKEAIIRESAAKIPNCQVLFKPLNIDDLEECITELFQKAAG